MSTADPKTTEHLDEIRKWAEERNGEPAKIKETGGKGDGILRINFPGYPEEGALQKISWQEWYEIFKKKHLSFLYQEKTKDGEESRFFKLVSANSL